MMRLKLVEDITNKIEYKSISNIDKFKKYADEILGGYGGMSDSDIKKDIQEIYINDELKGYIGLSKYNEEDGTKLLGIGNFMIIERGKGYGTQVIKDIVSKYKNQYDLIYCFVDSDNEGAISLYKKLGKVYDEDGPNDNGQYYVTFYDNDKYKLEESWQTGFEYGYAGYILRNGDIITLDDVPYNDKGDMRLAQHGEGDQDLPKEDKTLEISNSHNEDDTCVRLYDIPTNEQYKSLEFVIDKYLDKEGYCKVEFFNLLKHKYVIFANDTLEYSSFPYSAEEVNFADKVYEGSRWNGYTIVRWIKQNINKQGLVEFLTEASFKHSYKTAFGKSNQYRGFTILESKNNIAIYDGLISDQNLVESNFKSLDDAKLYIDLITGYARKSFNADYKYSIILLLSAGLDEKLKSMIEDGIELRSISKKDDDLDFYIQIVSKKDNLDDIIKKYNLQNYVVNFRKKSDYAGPKSSHSIEDLLRLGHASRREDAIAYYDNLNLVEAKKKRKKQTQNNLVFKSVDDLKKWVKKRQKGLSPFTYLNPDAGNVEYNQSMFNNMMGAASDGGSSLGTSVGGGTSNGGLSAAGDAGAGGGMGESLDANKSNMSREEKLAREFIRQNKAMINAKLEEFIAYCFIACDQIVFETIIYMLRKSNIEIPKPEKISEIILNNGGWTNSATVNHYMKQKGELDKDN